MSACRWARSGETPLPGRGPVWRRRCVSVHLEGEHVAEDDEALRPAAGHGDPRPDPRHCDLNRGRALGRTEGRLWRARRRLSDGSGNRRHWCPTAAGDDCEREMRRLHVEFERDRLVNARVPADAAARAARRKAREPRARRGGTRTPGLGAARRPRPGPAPWAKVGAVAGTHRRRGRGRRAGHRGVDGNLPSLSRCGSCRRCLFRDPRQLSTVKIHIPRVGGSVPASFRAARRGVGHVPRRFGRRRGEPPRPADHHERGELRGLLSAHGWTSFDLWNP